MSSAKISRNDPCPCGSGKKFKRCHGVAGIVRLAPPPGTPTWPGSQAQLNALREIERFAADPSNPVTKADALGFDDEGTLGLRLTLNTTDLEVVEGGLPLSSREEVIIPIPFYFPWDVRFPLVDHDRFVGHAHVLVGRSLCIFLERAQEWHPSLGISGYLDRLWTWLTDAAAGRFDARAALFHPVGGVPYSTPGCPTIVVREALDLGNQTYRKRWLRERTPTRLDLVAEPGGSLEIPIIALPGQLSFGVGATMGDLRDNVDRVRKGVASDALQYIDDTIRRTPTGNPQYFLLAVPRPKGSGPEDVHLIAGRMSSTEADRIRSSSRTKKPIASLGEDTPIEWCLVSDERAQRTTRRDVRRPVASFKGKTIVLWGCGGLGTWIGEFIARAGAKKIILADPGTVTGGLLVRQDFDESDVGAGKALALQRRLRAIHDRLEVVVEQGFTSITASGDLPDCDVLIDATINNSVGAAIEAVWATSRKRPLIARLCTDRATSTLGLMTVSRPGSGPGLDDLDERAGKTVENDPELEPFRCFWEEPGHGDEIVPEPGCSVPTFHGSAADLASITGVLTSLLGRHVGVDNPGTHLVGLPHGPGATVPHCWIAEEA